MYLRTPKRYQRGYRRNIISWRRLLLWVLAPPLIFIFIGIYENREMFKDDVNEFVETYGRGQRKRHAFLGCVVQKIRANEAATEAG